MSGEGIYKLCIGYWQVATRNQDKLPTVHTHFSCRTILIDKILKTLEYCNHMNHEQYGQTDCSLRWFFLGGMR